MGLLEDLRLSKFEIQMQRWYPHARIPCVADSVRVYCKGYLEEKRFVLWNEDEYRQNIPKKQCLSGFRSIFSLCDKLSRSLSDRSYLET